MGKGRSESSVLDNIKAEQCIDPRIESEFFQDIAHVGTPTNAKQAWGFAKDVVNSKRDRYLFCGNLVPASEFVQLFRLQDYETLKFLVPELEMDLGLHVHQPIKTEYGGKSRSIIVWRIRAGMIHVKLGHKLRKPIVWVTDYDEVEPLLNDLKEIPRSLIERLGIIGLETQSKCLVILYNRRDTASQLHVPRVLDALEIPQFQPVRDCSATSGTTVPLDDSTDYGLPEAIHGYCTLRPESFEEGAIV